MLEKAQIIEEATSTSIPVMFNPTELNDNYTVETEGEGSEVQFLQVIRDNFDISLFFDTYAAGTDVRNLTKKISALMVPSEGTGARKQPPICIFSWNQAWFKGIITSFKQNFTMFLESGLPVRARVTVTFKSVLTQKEQLQSLGLNNCRQFYRVKENDRIYLIAQKTLGSARLWRLIAEENKISDPLNFPGKKDIGRLIFIPDLHVP